MQGDDGSKPWAWAKLNAYGFVLAGLALLSILDLIRPAGTSLAQLVGTVPPGQTWWTLGFGISGMLLIYGFLRTDRIAETLGLMVLTLAVAAQTAASFALLGWVDYTLTRLVIVGILLACTWARVTVLWSREGIAVTIPARGVKRGGRR